MKFYDLTPDEREQWRKDEVTVAYVEELTSEAKLASAHAMSSLQGARLHDAAWHAATANGYLLAVDIAVRR